MDKESFEKLSERHMRNFEEYKELLQSDEINEYLKSNGWAPWYNKDAWYNRRFAPMYLDPTNYTYAKIEAILMQLKIDVKTFGKIQTGD